MKRAPTKKRLALILNREGNVAGLPDHGVPYAVEMLEEGVEETTAVPLDGEEAAELEDVLDELGITDIVTAYYEDRIFGQLRGEGFSLWLAPSETSRAEAIKEWHENVLTTAEAGVAIYRQGHLRHVPAAERSEE
jgi:hypothetical protein